MSFLSPTFLFALGAVSLPIAIHLINKSKLKQVRWAAMRFILVSMQRNRRRLQMEDLLLLLLRCLIIALIALAFARPALHSRVSGVDLSTTTTAVFIIDQTASMGLSSGGETRFDQAKSSAKQLLDKLASGSSAALFISADRTQRLVPKPSVDRGLLRRSLETAQISARGGDLFPAIRDAVDLLKSAPGKKDIFVFTDSQTAAWKQLDKVKELRDQTKGDIAMHFITVGDKAEPNLAITGINLESSVPAVGQPARCGIEVKNFSNAAMDNVRVTLSVDQDKPLDEALIPHIDANGVASVSLFAKFKAPGYHTVTANIPPDPLIVDNQRSVAVLAVEQLHALVIEGGTILDPAERDGLFLGNALAPVAPTEAARFYLKPNLAPSSALETPALTEADVVLLSNVSTLSPKASEALHHYVTNGGSVIIFPGPTANLAFYNTDRDFSAILPAKLGPAKDGTGDDKVIHLMSRNFTHPVTSIWNQPESGDLGHVQISRYYPLTPINDSVAKAGVMLRLEDGSPAYLVHTVGKGHVALFTSTGTTLWNNFPVHSSFVPMLHRLIAYMTQREEVGLALTPGQPFSRTVSAEFAGKDFSVLRPGDKDGRRIAGKIEPTGEVAKIQYNDTETPGSYFIYIGDDARPLVTFAVQPDASESDLTPEAAAQLANLLTPEEASAAKAGSSALPTEQTNEFWIWLIGAALLVAIVEITLAHRFSQAK